MSLKSKLGVDEIKNWRVLLKQLFAECLGTFLYLSICLLASDQYAINVTVAFTNGLLIASIVQIVGHVSGGHLNPAVSMGVMVCGHIKPLKAVCYIVVQTIGALAGSIVAYGVSEISIRGNLGATIPHVKLRVDQVFGLELLMTFVLVSVALSVLDPRRGARGLGSAPLAIGLSLTACQCACFSYTGGSLNPVRSLGPAVIMNIWTDHWVYWVAPLLGGLLAGVVYRNVLNLHIIFNVTTTNTI